jgi:hypothetical protein
MAEAINWMTGHNLIRARQEPEADSKRGRKRSPVFEVNPALSTSPRFRHFRRNTPP